MNLDVSVQPLLFVLPPIGAPWKQFCTAFFWFRTETVSLHLLPIVAISPGACRQVFACICKNFLGLL